MRCFVRAGLWAASIAGLLCAGMPAQAQQPVRVQVVATGLQNPWGLAFLPDGRFLVTERAGRMRVLQADGRAGAPLTGLPPMAAGGQGGLLDVVTDSAFARNRTL